MSFVGNIYRAADYTLPTYYHPGAAFQSQAVANCLKNSYFAAQQNSRLILQAVFPINLKLISSTQAEFMVNASAMVEICKGHVFIPEKVTHLCASINYAAMSKEGGQVAHKLKITNASAETLDERKDDFLPSGTATAPPASTYSALGFPPGLANQNLADFQPMGSSSVEVELEKSGVAAITLGQLCTIEVSAFAYFYRSYLGTDAAQYYRPFFVSVWTETRAE